MIKVSVVFFYNYFLFGTAVNAWVSILNLRESSVGGMNLSSAGSLAGWLALALAPTLVVCHLHCIKRALRAPRKGGPKCVIFPEQPLAGLLRSSPIWRSTPHLSGKLTQSSPLLPWQGAVSMEDTTAIVTTDQ